MSELTNGNVQRLRAVERGHDRIEGRQDRVERDVTDLRVTVSGMATNLSTIQQDISEIKGMAAEKREATRGEKIAMFLGGSAVLAAIITAIATLSSGAG